MLVERKVKLVTEQRIIKEADPQKGDFPTRRWSVRVFLLDDEGKEHTASVFQKVVYKLHPSFENSVQTFTKPDFLCENKGWGEFEMELELYTTEKGKMSVFHDLNFHNERYENIHIVTFKNPSQALQERLRETGPLPAEADSRPRKKAGAVGGDARNGKKSGQKLELYESIATALESLDEESLPHVIQLISNHRTEDTYIKSDLDVDHLAEAGEFQIDLYTMSDDLTTMLRSYLGEKGLMD